jgi:hypothetical protein
MIFEASGAVYLISFIPSHPGNILHPASSFCHISYSHITEWRYSLSPIIRHLLDESFTLLPLHMSSTFCVVEWRNTYRSSIDFVLRYALFGNPNCRRQDLGHAEFARSVRLDRLQPSRSCTGYSHGIEIVQWDLTVSSYLYLYWEHTESPVIPCFRRNSRFNAFGALPEPLIPPTFFVFAS